MEGLEKKEGRPPLKQVGEKSREERKETREAKARGAGGSNMGGPLNKTTTDEPFM